MTLRRYVFVTFFAIAVALGSSTLGDSARASAEWDIGAYDTCVSVFLAEYQKGTISFQQYNQSVKDCCEGTGGVWQGSGGTAQCVAPAVQGTGPQPTPTFQRPPDAAPTLSLAPTPDSPTVVKPPGRVG